MRVARNIAFCSIVAIGTIASIANGADAEIEKEARKMQSDAMDVDFLSLELKLAKKRLESAIAKCGKDKCSIRLLATLRRDLGIVLVNLKDKKGESELGAALALDAKLPIDASYLANAEVKRIWLNSNGAMPIKPAPKIVPTITFKLATVLAAPSPEKPEPESTDALRCFKSSDIEACVRVGDHESACALGRTASCDLQCAHGTFAACEGASATVREANRRKAASASVAPLLARCTALTQAFHKLDPELSKSRRKLLALSCEGTRDLLEDAIAEATDLEPTAYRALVAQMKSKCVCVGEE
jgi:hypothetical protein